MGTELGESATPRKPRVDRQMLVRAIKRSASAVFKFHRLVIQAVNAGRPASKRTRLKAARIDKRRLAYMALVNPILPFS